MRYIYIKLLVVFFLISSSLNYQKIPKHSNVILKNSEICKEKTLELVNTIISKQPFKEEYYRMMLVYSGKKINDLGDYHKCKSIPDNKANYFTLIISKDKIRFNIGLCIFKECDVDSMNELKILLIEIIKNTYHIELDEKDIIIEDIIKRDDSIINDNLVIIMIIFSITLLILVLYFINFIQQIYKQNLNSGNIDKKNFKETEVFDKSMKSEISHKKYLEDKNENNIIFKEKLLNEKVGESENMNSNFNKTDSGTESDKENNIYEINSKENEDTSLSLKKIPSIKISHSSHNFFHNFLSHFNFSNNLHKIMTVKVKENEPLRIFDGIRVLSCFWVVLGHGILIPLSIGLTNIADLQFKAKYYYTAIVFSGYFSVDVFFYLSAFMFCLSIQKYLTNDSNLSDENDKKGSISYTKRILIILKGIFSRYIRLLPLYLFTIFGMTTISKLMSYGSISYITENDQKNCLNSWYYNLLYVNNLVHYTRENYMCAVHSWYLANDMQFFIFSILIYILLLDYKIIRNLVIFLVLIGSLVFSAIYSINHNLGFNDFTHPVKSDVDYFNDYYIKPWIRIAPYIIGFYSCEFYMESPSFKRKDSENNDNNSNLIRRINEKIINSNFLSICLLILGIVLVNMTVLASYFTNNYEVDLKFQGIMLTFNKVLFVLGLAIIVHLTFLNKFVIIRKILSADIFNIIGKLTFAIYLIHVYVLFAIDSTLSTNAYFSLNTLTFEAFGYIIFTAIISLFASILFESPIISMLKT